MFPFLKAAPAHACGFAKPPARAPMSRSKLEIPGRVWAALIAGAISICGTVWGFTITVATDIRETRTEIHALHELVKPLEERIQRLEGVYIVK
jgi:hypothetical protein